MQCDDEALHASFSRKLQLEDRGLLTARAHANLKFRRDKLWRPRGVDTICQLSNVDGRHYAWNGWHHIVSIARAQLNLQSSACAEEL